MPAAKRAILDEGLRLFATRGVDAVSVRDIAGATKFTNPAIFRHFQNKEALARHIFEQSYARLVQILEGLSDEADLRQWLAAIFREIARAPEAVHFVLENLRRFFAGLPAELRARNLPALVRQRLEHEVQAGRLRADLDIPLARTLVVGLLAQIARATHFREAPIDPDQLAEHLHNLLMRGFAPDGARPR